MFVIKDIVVLLLFGNAFAISQPSGLLSIDHIFDTLSYQQWDDDEMLCRERIFNIFENVKNSTLWATWIWNSIDQSPTGIFFGARYHLGNYDQCLRPPWLATHPELRTQYCLAEIEMNKKGVKTMELFSDPYARAEKYYLDSQTILGRSFSYIAHGVCLPAGCPNKSVEKFVKALLSVGYLRAANNASVSIHHCEEAGVPHKYSSGFYMYMYTFAVLIFTAGACTYYVNHYSVTSDSLGNRLAQSFCIRRNWYNLVKTNDSELPCLDGIRVLSATLIPFIHVVIMVMAMSVSNGLEMELLSMRNPKAYLIIHSDLLTDSFLAMSGLLLGKSLAKTNITTPYSLLKKIFLRYSRLIGGLAVTVFYMAHVSMHTTDGPTFPKHALLEQHACEKNWWLTLLMVGNYVNVSEMCLPGSWYISCDFQLYVMTIILLFVYRKSPRVGQIVAAVVLMCGLLAPALTTYLHNLAGSGIYNIGFDLNVRTHSYYKYLYIRAHNRMGAYAAGLAAGYLMSIYSPKDHKKTYLKKFTYILGVCASLSLMMLVMAAGLLMYRYEVHGLLACVFAIFDRPAFAIGVLGVIAFCTYGDVPLINTFLSWSVFKPISRLSYGLYLIHQLILYRKILSIRNNMEFKLFEMFTESLGVTVVSLALSLGVWLLIEAPLFNIIDDFFRVSTSRYSKTGVYGEEKNNKQKAL